MDSIVRRLRENRLLNERTNYESLDRDELIKMAQNGDQLAVQTLINQHQDMIINYSKKYHLDTGDFDDVKQYVTIAFWDAIMKWDMTGNFEAYAGMIIKRKMADVLRSEDTEKVKISTKGDSLDAPSGTDDEGGEMTLGASLPSKSLSPEEEYLGNDGARKIMNFIQTELSDVERDVVLKYIKGYKVSEISEETGVKYKTVENALMRVKNKLADYMRGVRESRQLRVRESIFSEEEKQVLLSIFDKIESNEIKESKEFDDPAEALENRLLDIEYRAEEIDSDRKSSDNETLGEYEEELDKLSLELTSMEDDIPEDDDYLNKLLDRVNSTVSHVRSSLYDDATPDDPYTSIGMSRSDF